MKNKVIGISAIVLTLLLTSCGGGGSSSADDNYNPIDEVGGDSSYDTSNLDQGDTSSSSDKTNSGSDTITNSDTDTPQDGEEPTNTPSTVIDVTKPTINIIGDNPITITQGDTYSDAGATATDDIDESVSVTTNSEVDTNNIGSYTVKYTATDSSSNEATASRTVIVKVADTTAPIITITGDNPITITQGETYSDAGATATDDIDESVSVTPSGEVDMNNAGSYSITYTAIDSSGNEANATRTVIVKLADVIWNVSSVTEFRVALENASANGASDSIVLTQGTYNTTSDNLGTFKFSDNEEFDLTIRSADGLTYKDVVLDGNTTQEVFHFNNTVSSTLTLKGITVTNAKGSYGVNSNQNIIIEDANISDNNTTGFYAKGSATVKNSTVSSNQGNGFTNGSDTTVIDSNITHNEGDGFKSSGKATVSSTTMTHNSRNGFESSGTATIKDSTFSHNERGFNTGGGVNQVINSTISYNENNGLIDKICRDSYCSSYSPSYRFYYNVQGAGFKVLGDVNISNSKIHNNTNSYAYGSKKYAYGAGFYAGGKTYISDSEIYDNSVTQTGGGFYSTGAVTIENSKIYNNTATISNGAFATSSATVTDSTIQDNNGSFSLKYLTLDSVTLAGNTRFSFSVSTSLKIQDSTLFDNSGNFSFKGATITNTAFKNNSGTMSLSTGNFINNTFVLKDGDLSGGGDFINNIFKHNDNSVNVTANANMYNNYIDYTLIDDGGYNLIRKNNLQSQSAGDIYLSSDNETLLANSPAIDKGLNPSSSTFKDVIDNNSTYNKLVELLATDKVGNQRIYNGTIDMGAIEYGSSK